MTGLVVRAVALLSPLLLALTGCGENSGEGDTASQNPVITLNAQTDAWPTAQITGTLELRNGCLLIGNRVAVFPIGTTWESPAVVFEGGPRVRVGEQVTMGGGGFSAEDVTQDDLPIVPVSKVQACARRAEVDTFVWARPG